MIAFKNILCPVDFSEHSRDALQHAAMLGRWYNGEVTVLHAHGGLEPDSAAAFDLEQSAEVVRGADVPVTKCFQSGIATEVILDAVRALGSDLVVMGTHGRSGWDRLALGSVTEKVIRKVSCPVLTIPPRTIPPATAEPLGYERIVCAVDFNEWSMKGLECAASLAEQSSGLLIALHVIDDLHADRLTAYPGFDIGAYTNHVEQEGRNRLQRALPETRGRWTHEHLVLSGRPYEEIVRVARDRDAHLIVIGVHGRQAVDLMMFGSTTHHVIRAASCPVLTLRS